MERYFSITGFFLLVSFILFGITSCKEKAVNLTEVMLEDNWIIFSSENTQDGGDEISNPGYKANRSYSTHVPSTVLAALVENEVYKDIHFSDNFDKIPEEPFKEPWWYRTSFNLDKVTENENYRLIFEGINYRANVWLNGQCIAKSDTMEGCFRIFDFPVTQNLKSGENVLAVEIIPPKDQELTIGFVDWNPWPPDNNMGIWRPVKLVKSGLVSVNHVFVNPNLDTKSYEAFLEISAELTNHSNEEISGTVICKFDHISKQANNDDLIKEQIVEQPYTLKPKESKKIIFTSERYSELHLQKPKLWFPHQLGIPNLYSLEVTATAENEVSDINNSRFGIRDVKDYINDNGHRGYIINGHKMLIRGAGWVDDVLLADDDKKVENQIKYVKHMGLNTIRLEGFWGRNKKIYEYADELGILVMIGLSCQWEWEGYCGRPEDDKYMSIFTDEDIDIQSRSYMDQVLWLRNHPSVFLWVFGSDKLIVPEMEKKINEFMEKEDPSRPILGSCKFNVSEISGPTAVKMLGPYSYVTPNYWYVDTENGGAYGFNTETGPGIQPSPIESLRKMIPEESLWPINEIWQYHLGRNEFKKFDHWLPAFNHRYGEEDNVEDFAFKAQMSNYEAIRAMFEAFAVNKHDATGVIQWMLNSAMPGMLWQLYDWYLMPNGAFYGTKASCSLYNLVYNYGDGNIYFTNESYSPQENLVAEVRIFNIDSKEIYTQKVDVTIGSNTSKMILELPELKDLTTTYFLDLKLKNSDGEILKKNFYWLSTRKDILDYENSEWFVTPNKEYADFTALNTMPESEVLVDYEFSDNSSVQVTLKNPSDKIAFFIEMSLDDQQTGNIVLPIFWSDNYISLLPGETQVCNAYWNKEDLAGPPQFRYKGWNVK